VFQNGNTNSDRNRDMTLIQNGAFYPADLNATAANAYTAANLVYKSCPQPAITITSMGIKFVLFSDKTGETRETRPAARLPG
jgi:hypothetical protein